VEGDPYGHDEEFEPFSEDIERALLWLQEDSGLMKESVRWIHNRIDFLTPWARVALMAQKEEEGSGPGGGWFPGGMSKNSRQ